MRAPDDAEPRLGQARQRPLQPAAPGQHGVAGQPHVVEHELGGDRRAQRQLVVDRRWRENPGVSVGTTKPRMPVVGLGPDDRDVGELPLVIHIFVPLRTQSSPSRRGPGAHRRRGRSRGRAR